MSTSDSTVTVKGSYINFLQLAIAGAVGVGSFLAYSESKYASREMLTIEVEQRKSDIRDIKDLINIQNKKLDRIYEIIVMEEKHGK